MTQHCSRATGQQRPRGGERSAEVGGWGRARRLVRCERAPLKLDGGGVFPGDAALPVRLP